MGDPVVSNGDDRAKTLLILAGGVVATLAVVAGIVALWPSGDDDGIVVAERTTTTAPASSDGPLGEPSERTTSTTSAQPAPVDLFAGGLPRAYADLLASAGQPAQVHELAVYPSYAFLAYRDPAAPANIDRREWRDGEVGDAAPNPIDDRVDGDTEPALFAPAELDPAVVARVVADAPSRYDLDVAVTHVLIDRFLPFDQRVLIRVYASPTDGRSGGGYVSYDTAGAYVDVCC